MVLGSLLESSLAILLRGILPFGVTIKVFKMVLKSSI